MTDNKKQYNLLESVVDSGKSEDERLSHAGSKSVYENKPSRTEGNLEEISFVDIKTLATKEINTIKSYEKLEVFPLKRKMNKQEQDFYDSLSEEDRKFYNSLESDEERMFVYEISKPEFKNTLDLIKENYSHNTKVLREIRRKINSF